VQGKLATGEGSRPHLIAAQQSTAKWMYSLAVQGAVTAQPHWSSWPPSHMPAPP